MTATQSLSGKFDVSAGYLPRTGWMAGGFGSLTLTVRNRTRSAGRITAWSGVWDGANGAGRKRAGNILGLRAGGKLDLRLPSGERTETRLVCYLPEAVADEMRPRRPILAGALTVEWRGRTQEIPFRVAVQEAVLPEPLKRLNGRRVAMELMPSSLARFRRKREVLALLNDCYDAMKDLTGFVPFDGDTIVLKECPDHPFYAYAGNPIVLGTTRAVQQEIKNMDRDEFPFGWVHEIGHDFDFGGWYIFSDVASEWQANFKLAYCAETLEGYPFRHRFQRTGAEDGSGYGTPAGKAVLAEGRHFNDLLWLGAGDPYLADISRGWCDLVPDELHSFFHRMVRLYGWEPFKVWYRAFARLEALGLKRPPTDTGRLRLGAAILMETTGADLVPVYRRWRFPVTEKVVARTMEDYPIANAVRYARTQRARG